MDEYKDLLTCLMINEPRPKLPKPNKCSTCKSYVNDLLWCGKKNNKIKYNKYTWKCKICF